MINVDHPTPHGDRLRRASSSGQSAVATRQTATRELVLDTAERLFVEQGVLAVSNREIGEAAGYGNIGVAGYHFGTSADLVREITRRFTADVERSRVSMLAQLDESTGVRDWLARMVLPWTDHLAGLGRHSYFARLCAQAMTYPFLWAIMSEEATVSPSLRQTLAALNRYQPLMPENVATGRGGIVGHVIVHTCAERERALADGTPTPGDTWSDPAMGLLDALAGIWTAPRHEKPAPPGADGADVTPRGSVVATSPAGLGVLRFFCPSPIRVRRQ